MRLNIGETDFTPYVKYNAKSDQWFVRVDGNDRALADQTDLVMDLTNIETGWLMFVEGTAPVRVMDTSLTQAAQKPDNDKAKRGFVVNVLINGALHEFSSASGHVCRAVAELFEAWSKRTDINGKVAVVARKESKRMRDKHGTNYRPVFEIKELIDRPADLPNRLPATGRDGRDR